MTLNTISITLKIIVKPFCEYFLQDVANIKRCQRGLILYQVNPSSGEVEAATKFDFDIGRLKYDKLVKDFVQALIGKAKLLNSTLI